MAVVGSISMLCAAAGRWPSAVTCRSMRLVIGEQTLQGSIL